MLALLFFTGHLFVTPVLAQASGEEKHLGATTMLIRHSNVDVGAKGEEFVDVNPVLDAAGETWVFDRAEIHIERQRFANAQFASLPKAGCLDCDEISVRWYHEPTGYIRFRVLVWRSLRASKRDDEVGN